MPTRAMPLRLWLLKQTVNNDYETYDSCIVAAPDADTARMVRPDGCGWHEEHFWTAWMFKPEDITVRLIGTADPSVESGVVLASFNAG